MDQSISGHADGLCATQLGKFGAPERQGHRPVGQLELAGTVLEPEQKQLAAEPQRLFVMRCRPRASGRSHGAFVSSWWVGTRRSVSGCGIRLRTTKACTSWALRRAAACRTRAA